MARPFFWAPVSPSLGPYRGLTYRGHAPYAIDINRGYGTTDAGDPVLCSAAGHVYEIQPAYGLVKVRHWDGWSTWYGHLDRVSLRLGEQVWAGQQLGVIGRRYPPPTVLSPHLHYQQLLHDRGQQVYFDGVPYAASILLPAGLTYGLPFTGHHPTG